MRPHPQAPHSPLSARHHPDGVPEGEFDSLSVSETGTNVKRCLILRDEELRDLFSRVRPPPMLR